MRRDLARKLRKKLAAGFRHQEHITNHSERRAQVGRGEARMQFQHHSEFKDGLLPHRVCRLSRATGPLSLVRMRDERFVVVQAKAMTWRSQ